MKPEPYINGWFSHKNDIANNDDENPYFEKSQKYSHMQWLSGWCARFSAVKHGLDLSLDDMDIY